MLENRSARRRLEEANSMRKFLVPGIVAAALCGAPALAADMEMPVTAVSPPPAVWSWAGFYLGGSIGGGWA